MREKHLGDSDLFATPKNNCSRSPHSKINLNSFPFPFFPFLSGKKYIIIFTLLLNFNIFSLCKYESLLKNRWKSKLWQTCKSEATLLIGRHWRGHTHQIGASHTKLINFIISCNFICCLLVILVTAAFAKFSY